ncbi:unnamed protein product [Moneuplotes crassus]|uniref:EF-hand domain-containing protein n=1 Tax=Euplotes crassus TaxID=5936 RepID=A0AAD2D714_EUPCR|nr:unnamed protein product [Moneuplotes crassus]
MDGQEISEGDIRAAFDSFDENGDGSISKSEIEKVCQTLGVDADDSEISKLLNDADTDGDQKISYEEFKNAIQKES